MRERKLPLSDLVPWYLAQKRLPTVREVCDHFGVSISTANARMIEAEAKGLIERRTREDAWAK